MTRFLRCLVSILSVSLPIASYAKEGFSENPLITHWDSVFFVLLGGVIVWREVRASAHTGKQQRRRNGWLALEPWKKRRKNSFRLLPALAGAALRRMRR